MTGTALTAEELAEAKKKEEEAASLLAKEKATSATLTSQQADPPTKTGELTDAQKLRIFDIQSKTVKEQGARLSQTERDLADLKAKADEKPPITVEDSAKAFYADPIKAVKEALTEAIAPLNAFKDGFERDSEYVRIKNRLMANPVFAQHLNNPQFSAIVDEMVAVQQKIGPISDVMVEAAIKHTIGSVVTGDIVLDPVKGAETTETKTTTELKTEEPSVIPPYLQPSTPPQKTKTEAKQLRDLTENEDRLRREREMTKEDWLAWLEIDATDVIDSKIGLKPKEGDKK